MRPKPWKEAGSPGQEDNTSYGSIYHIGPGAGGVHLYAHPRVCPRLCRQRLGDDTAQRSGRLTLNPFSHLGPVGTADPVCRVRLGPSGPINPNNFKKPKRDMALSAMAGPASNLLLALFVLVIYRVVLGFAAFGTLWQYSATETVLDILWIVYSTNIMLAVFNLLPVPPLDGWKMMGAVLPGRIYWKIMSKEREIGMIFMLLILFTPVIDLPISFVGNAISDLFVSATAFVPRLMQAIL